VESLALGVPVAASNSSVFQESTKGKAVFLDPNNPIEWSEFILNMTVDKKFRDNSDLKAREFMTRSKSMFFQELESRLGIRND
jgi:hypothetical protein